MKHKFFLFFAALGMLLPQVASAYDFYVGGIYYNTSGSNATVTYKKSNFYSGIVVIPATVTYKDVTYNVTSIGEEAFYGCSGLTSITIPNSVTSIGEEAFYECKRLTSITIPNSVTSIGEEAFYGCSGLTSITIPNSVTSIGEEAFYGCSSVKTLIYAEGCTTVLKTGLESITSVSIPNSVTSIGEEAFKYCNGLTSITIPEGVTSIGEGAFKYCSGLTSVTIPNSVTSIKPYTFSGCSGLTSITIPNSVTSIGVEAFYECKRLTSITIPNSVTSIRTNAFYGCSRLTTVTTKATTPPTCENSAFDNEENSTLVVPIGCVLTYKKAKVWKDFGTTTDGEVQFSEINITTETTQSTITVKLDYDKEKCVPLEEIGVSIGNTYYKANSKGMVKFENLEPGTIYYFCTYAKYGGEYYLSSETYRYTRNISPSIAMSNVMANSASIRSAYDMGDAHIYKTTFEVTSSNNDYKVKEQESKNNKFTVTGLVPNTKYSITYKVHYHYGEGDERSGYKSITKDFTTAVLKMMTLNPKNVSSTSSVVAAEANISDEETGAGFEWRKYDAPESLPSSKGSAIVYGGRMEGKINNLQPVYYKVRPYYESTSGKVFYGEWTTFDPTDFSFFEPTVHTYDMIEDPSSNSVEVRGYVMQGTDNVTEQGFEYWKTGGSSRRQIASIGDVMRVQATGQLMIATLKDLDYESQYVVRAYVITASGTVYGEERTFTTPSDPILGISEVEESENVSRTLKGIYTLDGRKIERITTPGIYLYNGKKRMFKASRLPVE